MLMILVFVFTDAVLGIRDLLNKYPAELNLHKYAIIEKLRERISDDDNLVRGTLYELFKTVIFPGCKEVIFLASLVKFLLSIVFDCFSKCVN